MIRSFLFIFLFFSTILFANNYEEMDNEALESARKDEVRKTDPNWIFDESYQAGYSLGVKFKYFVKDMFKDDKKEE